jgi:ribosome-associated protein
MKKIDFLKIARKSARIADDKKGKDIVILNVKRLTIVANYFLIVTVDSSAQMRAVIDTIHEIVKQEDGVAPLRREGGRGVAWAVLDYGGLVIHVMTPQIRALYALEKLWSAARRIK